MIKSKESVAIAHVDKALSKQIMDIQNSSTMSALILSACLIDALAGFYAGYNGEGTRHKSRFNKFTNKYLSKYHDFLYELRNGLVHSFANNVNFIFTENDEFSTAFPSIKQVLGKELFNVSDFKKSVVNAYSEYIQDLSDLENKNLRANFMIRYNKLGIIKDSALPVIRNFKGEIITNIEDADKLPGTDIPIAIADPIRTKS